MNGFYPKRIQRYKSKLNARKNCYEIVDTWSGKPVRSRISTRIDASNKCVSMNFKYGVRRTLNMELGDKTKLVLPLDKSTNS